MKYTIIIDKQPSTNPSEGKKEYVIDIEELRTFRGVSDTLKVTPDMAYVIRRLTLSEYGVLSILDEPKQENIKDLNITLFEGDNYIYILNQQGNVISASYTIKNKFTDIYPTKAEMNSAITQSASSVEISVSQKLENYSTTEETKALIQTTSDTINLELKKKVNDEDLTGANITLRINQDTSEATINADKININGTISANGNFKIDTKGNMECNNAKISGGTISLTDPSGTGGNLQLGKDGNGSISWLRTDQLMLRSENSRINLQEGQEQNGIMIDEIGYLDDKYPEINVGASLYIDTIFKTAICSVVYNDVGNGQSLINLQSDSEKAEIWVLKGNQSTYIRANEIVTPTLTQTSMASEKKNFEKMQNALDLIKGIDIYKYNLKYENDNDKKHIGFVIGNEYKYRQEVTNKDNTGAEIYSLASLGIQGIKELDERLRKVEKILEVS